MKRTVVLVLDFPGPDAEPLAAILRGRGLQAVVLDREELSGPDGDIAPETELLLVPARSGSDIALLAGHSGEDETGSGESPLPAVAILGGPADPGLEVIFRRIFPDGLVIRSPDPGLVASILLLALEKRRSDIQLAQTRAWLDAMFQGFAGYIYMCAADYTVEYMNENFIARTGYDGTGEPCYAVLHDRDSVCPWCLNDRVFAGETVRWEKQSPKDGRWLSMVNIPVRHADGRLSKLSMMLDITEYKKIEEDLQRAKQKYRTIFDNAMEGIFQSTREGRFLDANPAMAGILGYESPEELMSAVTDIGRQLYVDPARRAEFFRYMLKGQSVPGFEVEFRRKDGRRIWVFLAARPVFDDAGEFLYSEGILMDVTGRKRAEAKVHRLTRQVLGAHEAERRRISRDLHDQVAQDLSSLKIQVETLAERCAGDPAALAAKLAEAGARLGEAVAVVRDLAYDLRPPGLDQLGLAGAISQHLEDFARKTGLMVKFYKAGMDGLKMGEEVAVNLYRLAREALWNAYKHSRASNVVVRLVASHPSVILRVEDNGRGFDPEAAHKGPANGKRMGITGMRERAALLGGRISIRSRPGAGTAVIVEIPVAVRYE